MPVIRITRRPPTSRPFGSVVSFSSMAADSPGAPLGQRTIGFISAAGAAAAERQSSMTIRMPAIVAHKAPRDRLCVLRIRMKRAMTVFTCILAIAGAARAQREKPVGDDKSGYTDTPQLPGQPWKVHDAARKRPPKVTPGEPLLNEAPPSDAIVLFNGKDLSHWTSGGRDGKTHDPQWKVENGYMEIAPHSGGLITKEKFGDCQLHLEWMVPKGVEG